MDSEEDRFAGMTPAEVTMVADALMSKPRERMTDEQAVLSILRKLVESGYAYVGDPSPRQPAMLTVNSTTDLTAEELSAFERWQARSRS